MGLDTTKGTLKDIIDDFGLDCKIMSLLNHTFNTRDIEKLNTDMDNLRLSVGKIAAYEKKLYPNIICHNQRKLLFCVFFIIFQMDEKALNEYEIFKNIL